VQRAASLAGRLRRVPDVEVKMIQGAGGIFDVVVDGKRVFSKSETGRFPDPDDILRKLKL
jgi:selT/selW/selH-like putative selenoprotein